MLHDKNDEWRPPAPAGWASTDDAITGEIALLRGKQTYLRIDLDSGSMMKGNKLADHRLPFLGDLVTAHNAYFRTDPEGEAKLDRELGQALKADAEKRAVRAAKAIVYGLVSDPEQKTSLLVGLVASFILASQR